MSDRVSQMRLSFEKVRPSLSTIYEALDWEQKASVLKALIEAGDHPPGFHVAFDLSRTSEAERAYLRAIGIGPFSDGNAADAR